MAVATIGGLICLDPSEDSSGQTIQTLGVLTWLEIVQV